MSPCTKYKIMKTKKSECTHEEEEMTGTWRHLNNNALHDFYSSAHSVTSLMYQACKKQNGGVSMTHEWRIHKKVKCTLVQVLRLCTGRPAYRGSRGIALLFHDQWH
jgi:hypothetical protein